MAYETAASSAAAASASKTFYICVMYKLQLHYNVQITKCCSKFNIEFSAVPARCYIWYWKASLQTCVLLIDEQNKNTWKLMLRCFPLQVHGVCFTQCIWFTLARDVAKALSQARGCLKRKADWRFEKLLCTTFCLWFSLTVFKRAKSGNSNQALMDTRRPDTLHQGDEN